jgi:hypothetical protein
MMQHVTSAKEKDFLRACAIIEVVRALEEMDWFQ